MNLTVQDALKSIETQSTMALRDPGLQSNIELVDNFRELHTAAEGCLSMLSDLNTACESLHAGGFTQEWFDVVNKDGAFLAITNIEMPKFFGGDQAKFDACEAGTWDAIKVWAAKAWEVIKSIIKFIFKCLHELVNFWGREKSQTRTRAQVVTRMAGDYLKKIEGEREAKIQARTEEILASYIHFKARDIDTIDRYIARLMKLVTVIDSLDANKVCQDPEQKSGNFNLEVMSTIVNECYRAGIQPDKDYNGYELTSETIIYTPPTSIEEREYILDSKATVDTIVQVVNDVSMHIDSITQALNAQIAFMQTFQKTIQQYIDQFKQQKQDYTELVASAKRAHFFANLISNVLQQATRLSIEWNRFNAIWMNSFTEWKKKNP